MSARRSHVRIAVDVARSPDKQQRFLDAVRRSLGTLDGLSFAFAQEGTPIESLVGDAHVLVATIANASTLERAPALEWIHLYVAGVDATLSAELTRRPIVVTNLRGMHAVQMAEHALALMLAFARRLHECMRGQVAREWRQRLVIRKNATLAGRRLGILGLGSIGSALAQRAHALGMEVWGLCRDRSARPAPPAGVARLLGPSDLDTLLEFADYLVVLLPLTPSTRHILDAAHLARLRPTSILINLGRGELIDEPALVAALESSRLAGAGLDVFEKEPLPAASPLWAHDQVIITPHSSGNYPEYVREATAIFVENLERFLEGRPLTRVVDKKEGY